MLIAIFWPSLWSLLEYAARNRWSIIPRLLEILSVDPKVAGFLERVAALNSPLMSMSLPEEPVAHVEYRGQRVDCERMFQTRQFPHEFFGPQSWLYGQRSLHAAVTGSLLALGLRLVKAGILEVHSRASSGMSR